MTGIWVKCNSRGLQYQLVLGSHLDHRQGGRQLFRLEHQQLETMRDGGYPPH